jgi:glycine/D-amino acid oxidase-like deaminating enzyme
MKSIRVDVCVVGGGVCGLYVENILRKSGYSVVVVQKGPWGEGQSALSQGIFHRGYKYLDKNSEGTFRRNLAESSELWQSFLMRPENGFGLSHDDFRSIDYLFFDEQQPPCDIQPFRSLGFTGQHQISDEAQLEPALLIQKLSSKLTAGISTKQGARVEKEGRHTTVVIPEIGIRIEPSFTVLAAGEPGIAIFNAVTGQALLSKQRPLVQVSMAGMNFPLSAHIFQKEPRPELTITSVQQDGSWTWFIGGGAAETTDPSTAVERATEKLKLFFTNLSLGKVLTHEIIRQELYDGSSDVSSDFRILMSDDIALCLPTKATLVPLLANSLLEKIGTVVAPKHGQPSFPALQAVSV